MRRRRSTCWPRKGSTGRPVVNLYLGEIAYRQKQYARAVAALGRARDLVSQNPNASAHLAISYLQTAQQQKAFAILDGIQPEQIEPRSQFELGLALEQLGSSARSLPYLEAVHRRYPDAYDIGFDLMLGYLAAGTYQTAIEVGRDLIARGHETAELNNILAEAYAGNTRFSLPSMLSEGPSRSIPRTKTTTSISPLSA